MSVSAIVALTGREANIYARRAEPDLNGGYPLSKEHFGRVRVVVSISWAPSSTSA
jgi:hypothetical protein